MKLCLIWNFAIERLIEENRGWVGATVSHEFMRRVNIAAENGVQATPLAAARR
jgi:hypothetical protein